MRDELIVYWTPQPFVTSKDSWDLLYRKPENVYTQILEKSSTKSPIRVCPAIKNQMKRTFSFYSCLNDHIDFSNVDLKHLDESSSSGNFLPIESYVSLSKDRPSSFPGYINFSYNLSWLFFAEEPLVARMTAPYFPSITPTEGAYLAPGEFDIGQWLRPFNLDYHIPYTAKSFNINTQDPLFFLELFTDKKVIFKRFVKNERIDEITNEVSNAPVRYGVFEKLSERYDMFNKTKLREIILKEIKKEVVE